jgi:hypothetical protein
MKVPLDAWWDAMLKTRLLQIMLASNVKENMFVSAIVVTRSFLMVLLLRLLMILRDLLLLLLLLLPMNLLQTPLAHQPLVLQMKRSSKQPPKSTPPY